MDRETKPRMNGTRGIRTATQISFIFGKTEKKKQVDHGKEKKKRKYREKTVAKKSPQITPPLLQQASELKKKKTALQTETFQEEQKISMIN